MRRRTLLIVLAGSGVMALGLYAWRTSGVHQNGAADSRGVSLETAIADIEAGRRTTPLIGTPTAAGDATVTFLAKRDGDAVPRTASDVTGWGEHVDGTFDATAGTMTRIGRTDWYSLQARVAPRARIEYLLAYGLADYRLDPHNPRQSAGPQFGGIRASEFVMPGYEPPPEFAGPPGAAAGRFTENEVESRAARRTWRVIVYTPRGYRAEGDYPVAVFLDLRSGQISRVLDWLIAHRDIEPLVAVFVGPAAHATDHPTSEALREFLTTELRAWLTTRYGISRDAARRAVIGISFGGKDAIDAAIFPGGDANATGASGFRTNGFGLLGLLIPGRRIDRADLDAIAGPRTHHLRVAILAGQYDQANLATAQRVRQALVDAGDRVDFIEVPEGHSAVTWTHHLRALLVSLFGPAPAAGSLRDGERARNPPTR
jgi:enterochelin esterase-like enzyme